MARQWRKGPQGPFPHKQRNAKTTRGLDTNKLAAALQQYALGSRRQAGTPGSAAKCHRVHTLGETLGPPPPSSARPLTLHSHTL